MGTASSKGLKGASDSTADPAVKVLGRAPTEEESDELANARARADFEELRARDPAMAEQVQRHAITQALVDLSRHVIKTAPTVEDVRRVEGSLRQRVAEYLAASDAMPRYDDLYQWFERLGRSGSPWLLHALATGEAGTGLKNYPERLHDVIAARDYARNHNAELGLQLFAEAMPDDLHEYVRLVVLQSVCDQVEEDAARLASNACGWFPMTTSPELLASQHAVYAQTHGSVDGGESADAIQFHLHSAAQSKLMAALEGNREQTSEAAARRAAAAHAFDEMVGALSVRANEAEKLTKGTGARFTFHDGAQDSYAGHLDGVSMLAALGMAPDRLDPSRAARDLFEERAEMESHSQLGRVQRDMAREAVAQERGATKEFDESAGMK